MVLLDDRMIELGVTVNAAWRRWDHYSIEYLVPEDDCTVLLFCQILSSWYPGEAEFLEKGDRITTGEWKTITGRKPGPPVGKTLIKANLYYAPISGHHPINF